MTPQTKLSTAQAIDYLRDVHGVSVSVPTLSRWRNDPRFASAGPQGHRVGARRYVYRVEDLDRWANGQAAPTAEPAGV